MPWGSHPSTPCCCSISAFTPSSTFWDKVVCVAMGVLGARWRCCGPRSQQATHRGCKNQPCWVRPSEGAGQGSSKPQPRSRPPKPGLPGISLFLQHLPIFGCSDTPGHCCFSPQWVIERGRPFPRGWECWDGHRQGWLPAGRGTGRGTRSLAFQAPRQQGPWGPCPTPPPPRPSTAQGAPQPGSRRRNPPGPPSAKSSPPTPPAAAPVSHSTLFSEPFVTAPSTKARERKKQGVGKGRKIKKKIERKGARRKERGRTRREKSQVCRREGRRGNYEINEAPQRFGGHWKTARPQLNFKRLQHNRSHFAKRGSCVQRPSCLFMRSLAGPSHPIVWGYLFGGICLAR